ncbi:MAG: hypothetical protein U9O98_02295, partial [Asgard group archaeon]|nr:hypothetical protein [Asgard group archaeon]
DYSTPGMFEILEHPNIKTETSGMHGGDCAVFYKNCLNLTENWQSSVMFGTDHSYFSVPQASDHLCFLFSQEAKDLGITIEDLKKVCHLNAYHMLKLYWPEEILKRKGMKKVKVKNEDFSQILNCITTNELVNTLGKIAKESGIFYTIDFIFNPGQTQVYNDIYILNLFVEKKNLKRSFVVQQPEKTKVKISEITQIRKYVEKITSILQEKENPYPFSKKYLMDYLLRQTAYSSRQSESNE